jgi:hypothetical protein
MEYYLNLNKMMRPSDDYDWGYYVRERERLIKLLENSDGGRKLELELSLKRLDESRDNYYINTHLDTEEVRDSIQRRVKAKEEEIVDVIYTLLDLERNGEVEGDLGRLTEEQAVTVSQYLYQIEELRDTAMKLFHELQEVGQEATLYLIKFQEVVSKTEMGEYWLRLRFNADEEDSLRLENELNELFDKVYDVEDERVAERLDKLTSSLRVSYKRKVRDIKRRRARDSDEDDIYYLVLLHDNLIHHRDLFFEINERIFTSYVKDLADHVQGLSRETLQEIGRWEADLEYKWERLSLYLRREKSKGVNILVEVPEEEGRVDRDKMVKRRETINKTGEELERMIRERERLEEIEDHMMREHQRVADEEWLLISGLEGIIQEDMIPIEIREHRLMLKALLDGSDLYASFIKPVRSIPGFDIGDRDWVQQRMLSKNRVAELSLAVEDMFERVEDYFQTRDQSDELTLDDVMNLRMYCKTYVERDDNTREKFVFEVLLDFPSFLRLSVPDLIRVSRSMFDDRMDNVDVCIYIVREILPLRVVNTRVQRYTPRRIGNWVEGQTTTEVDSLVSIEICRYCQMFIRHERTEERYLKYVRLHYPTDVVLSMTPVISRIYQGESGRDIIRQYDESLRVAREVRRRREREDSEREERERVERVTAERERVETGRIQRMIDIEVNPENRLWLKRLMEITRLKFMMVRIPVDTTMIDQLTLLIRMKRAEELVLDFITRTYSVGVCDFIRPIVELIYRGGELRETLSTWVRENIVRIGRLCGPPLHTERDPIFLPGEDHTLIGRLRRARVVESRSEDTRCSVCLTNEHNIKYKPCGHKDTCSQCTITILRGGHLLCPYCRGAVLDFEGL